MDIGATSQLNNKLYLFLYIASLQLWGSPCCSHKRAQRDVTTSAVSSIIHGDYSMTLRGSSTSGYIGHSLEERKLLWELTEHIVVLTAPYSMACTNHCWGKIIFLFFAQIIRTPEPLFGYQRLTMWSLFSLATVSAPKDACDFEVTLTFSYLSFLFPRLSSVKRELCVSKLLWMLLLLQWKVLWIKPHFPKGFKKQNSWLLTTILSKSFLHD